MCNYHSNHPPRKNKLIQGFGLRFGERESEAEVERRRERSRSATTVAEPQAEGRRSFGITKCHS
jgi:hypothetical protein